MFSAGKMVSQTEALSAEPDELSWVPGAHIVEGDITDSRRWSSDFQRHTVTCVYSHDTQLNMLN